MIGAVDRGCGGGGNRDVAVVGGASEFGDEGREKGFSVGGAFHAGECLAAPYRFPKVSEKLIHGEGHPLSQSSEFLGDLSPAEMHGSEVRGVSQNQLVHHFRVGGRGRAVIAREVDSRLPQPLTTLLWEV